MKKFFIKKNARRIFTVVFSVLLVLLVLLVGNIIYSQITHKVPAIFGYSVMNIIAGSMEPVIPKNTFILIKQVDPEQLQVGDVITFYSSDPLIQGLPNTHRIFDIVVENGQKFFVTKGDANAIPDSYNVGFDDVIGVYVRNIISLGKIGLIFQNKSIVFVLLVVPAAVLFIMEIINLTKTAAKVKQEDIESVSNEDKCDDVESADSNETDSEHKKSEEKEEKSIEST
ncbi:MAG TPA: signal peptidase I [Clostridia bacterium]|nr:signal peptidase I [Clostridia bacterium]